MEFIEIVIAIIAAIVLFLVVKFYERKVISGDSGSNIKQESIEEKLEGLKVGVNTISVAIDLLQTNKIHKNELEVKVAQNSLTLLENTVKKRKEKLKQDQEDIRTDTIITNTHFNDISTIEIESVNLDQNLSNYDVTIINATKNLQEVMNINVDGIIQDQRFLSPELRKKMLVEKQDSFRVVILFKIDDKDVMSHSITSSFNPYLSVIVTATIQQVYGENIYSFSLDFSEILMVIDPNDIKANGKVLFSCIGKPTVPIDLNDINKSVISYGKNGRANGYPIDIKGKDNRLFFYPILHKGKLKSGLVLKTFYPGEYILDIFCIIP